MNTIGRRLKRLREQKELSQNALATYSGVGRSYIGQIEEGTSAEIGASRLVALAKVLETSVDYLLGQTADPRPAGRLRPGELTYQEEELLALFRSMDDIGRQIALATLRAQAAIKR